MHHSAAINQPYRQCKSVHTYSHEPAAREMSPDSLCRRWNSRNSREPGDLSWRHPGLVEGHVTARWRTQWVSWCDCVDSDRVTCRPRWSVVCDQRESLSSTSCLRDPNIIQQYDPYYLQIIILAVYSTFILTNSYLVTAGSFRTAPYSHSLIKLNLWVPVTRFL